MGKYGLVAVLVAAALAASFYVRGHSRSVITIAPSAQKASDTRPVDLPMTVVEELTALKPGITVAEWRRSHPADEWHAPTYRDDREYWPFVFGNFCAVSTLAEHVLNGHDLVRKAAFYIPAPPASMALPSNSSASSLLDTCTLGYIQIELMTEDNNARAKLDADVQAVLSGRFGPSSDEPNEMVLAPVFSKQIIPVWKMGNTKIVDGTILQRLPSDQQYSASQFSTYSYLPVFRFEKTQRPDEPYDPITAENSPEIFQLAFSTAALDPKLSGPIADVYRKWTDFYQRKSALPYQEQPGLPRPIQPREVASALQPWLEASQKLPVRRRAAALLAAQFVVEATWSEFSTAEGFSVVEEGSDAQRALEAAGAEFRSGGPDGIQPIVQWVQEARDIDPDGPIGDAITLMTLSGWHFRELFPAGYGDVSDYVIAAGEKYLSRPRDSATIARVEYSIASAYCDRVLISQFGDDGGEGAVIPPTQEQLGRGAAAKPEALKHYQSMLALDRTSHWAIAAWRSGWRLMAELPVYRHYSIAGE